MCRHLAYLGPRRCRSARLPRRTPAARPVPAVLGAAPAAARHGQRRRVRRRLVRRGRPGARPLPPGRARSGRDLSFADLARVVRTGALLAAVRDATAGRRGRRGRGRAVRRRALAVQPQRRGRRAGRARWRRWPRRCPPAELLSLEARCDSALVWALVLHRLRAGDELGPGAGRHRRWRSPRPRPAPGSTCCSPTARPSPRPPGATPCGTWPSPAGGTVVASEPYDDDPALAARSPTAPCSRRAAPTSCCTPLKEPSAPPRSPHVSPFRSPAPCPRTPRTPPCAPMSLHGPDPHPQDAAAEVVLRRPRQRAVRADHRAARVLPDPRRAGDPRSPAPARSPRRPAPAPWSSWAPAPRRRPGTCSTR